MDLPLRSNPSVFCGLAPANASHPRRFSTGFFSKLPSVATDYALVAGLLDAFVTAHNLQRTNRSPGLNFHEFMHGKNQNDNCSVPRVGSHLPDDVIRVTPGTTQTRSLSDSPSRRRNFACYLDAGL